MATTDHHWSLHIDHHLVRLSLVMVTIFSNVQSFDYNLKLNFFFFFGEMKWKWKKIELLSFWFDSRELILIKILLCFFPIQTKSESCCFFIHSFIHTCDHHHHQHKCLSMSDSLLLLLWLLCVHHCPRSTFHQHHIVANLLFFLFLLTHHLPWQNIWHVLLLR